MAGFVGDMAGVENFVPAEELRDHNTTADTLVACTFTVLHRIQEDDAYLFWSLALIVWHCTRSLFHNGVPHEILHGDRQ